MQSDDGGGKSVRVAQWSGVTAIAMSLVVLILIVGDTVFAWNPVPIHDEGAIEHIAMLLMVGQLPFTLYFFYSCRRALSKIVTVSVRLLIIWGIIFSTLYFANRATEKAVAVRIAANVPLPGSDDVLRHYIEELQHGGSGDELMDPFVARFAGVYLGVDASLGPLQSLAFKGVDRLGWDIYDAHFTNGDLAWRIFVTRDGMIHGLTQSGVSNGCRSTEPYECRPIQNPAVSQ